MNQDQYTAAKLTIANMQANVEELVVSKAPQDVIRAAVRQLSVANASLTELVADAKTAERESVTIALGDTVTTQPPR